MTEKPGIHRLKLREKTFEKALNYMEVVMKTKKIMTCTTVKAWIILDLKMDCVYNNIR